MALVYKALGRDDVLISPFSVHKTHELEYTSGAAITEFNIATALDFTDPNLFDPNTAVTNSNGTFQGPLFKSVEHIFSDDADFAVGGIGLRDFVVSGSVYVINVPSLIFGQGIRPGSFTLINADDTTTASIVDDGVGRLYVSNSVVGNLFYNIGVAIINRITASFGIETISGSGLYVPSGSTYRATLDSTVTMQEYQVLCTVEPQEFNYASNPSAFGTTFTGSVSITDAMISGGLSPYITTIGLYNDRYELVAIAKLPNPVKRLSKSQQSVLVKFDI